MDKYYITSVISNHQNRSAFICAANKIYVVKPELIAPEANPFVYKLIYLTKREVQVNGGDVVFVNINDLNNPRLFTEVNPITAMVLYG